MLQAGDAAPDLTLPGAGGSAISLEALRGRKVVLYFYPKDDTNGCTRQALDFNAMREDFHAADTSIVGISPDSVASHDKFRRKHGLALDLAADESKATLEAYGVWTEKSMYGRKYMGVERTTFLLDRSGRIARIWRKVSVPGHADEVLAAASALA